jgi:ABC-2 type transport system ATP-binding protein
MSMDVGQQEPDLWESRPLESFRVLAAIYRLRRPNSSALDELVALLDLAPLWAARPGTFRWGERMKCELVAALLHRPAVLYSTSRPGLDVSMQRRLRTFVSSTTTATA